MRENPMTETEAMSEKRLEELNSLFAINPLAQELIREVKRLNGIVDLLIDVETQCEPEAREKREVKVHKSIATPGYFHRWDHYTLCRGFRNWPGVVRVTTRWPLVTCENCLRRKAPKWRHTNLKKEIGDGHSGMGS